MKVLVLGSNGQVGSEFCSPVFNCSSPRGEQVQIFTANRSDLDLTELSKIFDFLASRSPDFIVNASAYTAVEEAESQEELAFVLNYAAVVEMVKYCQVSGCSLISISTDYVFDGRSNRPYGEMDPVRPLSVYGRSKLSGENAIREVLAKYIILRTSWVFGAQGKNFVKTMLRVAESRSELDVVADQLGAPTAARAIMAVITRLITQLAGASEKDERWGTYHYAGYPFVSWADFANHIFEQAERRDLIRIRPTVNPIVTDDYPTSIVRPLNSRLDCSKLKNVFDIDPDDWQQSLGEMLDDLKKEYAKREC